MKKLKTTIIELISMSALLGFLLACSNNNHGDPEQQAGEASNDGARKQIGMPITPGAEFDMTKEEIASATEKANHGDITSIKRLVNYYSWVDSEPRNAIPWLREGARHGDAVLMLDLAGRISESGQKSDCLEARSLLERSLITASDNIRPEIQSDLALLIDGRNGIGPCVGWFKDIHSKPSSASSSSPPSN